MLEQFRLNQQIEAARPLPIDRFRPTPIDPNFPELPKRVRWRPELAELNKFWWKRPETVRILMYMDIGSFLGGAFSLQHVINAIESDPWPWAQFEVTKAHRGFDGTADLDSVTLTDLDLDDYDEVWLFGFSSDPDQLSAAEVAALNDFMDSGGGVLTTGDHGDLGRGFSGTAKRISKLRAYPAPPAASPVWNTTIRDANGDGDFQFDEQSDATPQTIRTRYWYSWGLSGGLRLEKFPHPVLCSEDGVLRKLPDHEHEGQVTIPATFPVAEWPRVGSFQPKPEVIAWGRILDPTATNTGQEFPVIGAYDGHGVDVGRIVADSTWHHWFDINLNGFNALSQDYKDIISYFQNVAAWLAPEGKQRGMRNGVFWLALHEEVFFELDFAKLPLSFAVKTARDALGRWAPQCLVHSWIFPAVPHELRPDLVGIDPAGPRVRQAVEDTVLVEMMASLQKTFDVQTGVLRPAESFAAVDTALAAAVPQATKRLVEMCQADMRGIEALNDRLTKVVDLTKTNGSAPRRTRKRAKAKA